MDSMPPLFDGQSRYTLEINDSPVTPDVLRFRGREVLSEPFHWEIDFTTPQADILPEQVLLKYATLRMRSGKTVHGIITRLTRFSSSADQSHYLIVLSSRLALLSHTRQCRIFQNQSVPEVAEQVLRDHGLEGADFDFRLERMYPERELITQWQETDLEFIQRILSETGIFWRTEMDHERELDVVIFADSQLNYRFDVRLPYSEPSGLYDGAEESVWDVRTWHRVVPEVVSIRDYNYRTAAMPMDVPVRVRSDAVTTGEHYRYNLPYLEPGDDIDPDAESGAFFARLCHERELNKSVCIHLFSNASGLAPGQVLEPQGNVASALQEGVIITLATYRASRDSRLHVSVWGMPYSERYCYRPVEYPRPEIHGTLPARIESREKNDIYAWLDETGRYRVRLDFDRNGSEQGYAYLWLRMAKPYAGETYGWHMPLTDGTEVAIGYSNGDIDLPYIACALHDSEHPDPVNRDNYSRNLLKTSANNKLRMEDKRGEEHIKLATEYGKSQLNTGHLVDNQQKPRGTGMELRTDEWGVIRAGKGLFVSADAQPKAQGEVLDMDAALNETERLQQYIQQLEAAAEQALALKADADSQVRMFSERLKPLNKILHFSAPQGMAFTSGEHMQLSAAKNAAINAGGDISVGVMGNMTMLAGDRLGMFAREGQLSLKSAEGAVEMQAQNGNMRLFAQKELSIVSENDILFSGKKRITLIGGGSYLKLEQGKVEYGTMGTYLRKVKRTIATGAAAMPLPGASARQGLIPGGAAAVAPDTMTLAGTQVSVDSERKKSSLIKKFSLRKRYERSSSASPTSPTSPTSPPVYYGKAPSLIRSLSLKARSDSDMLKKGVSSVLRGRGLMIPAQYCGSSVDYGVELFRYDSYCRHREFFPCIKDDFYIEKNNCFSDVILIAAGDNIVSKPGGAGPVGHYWSEHSLDRDINVIHIRNGLSGTVCLKLLVDDMAGTTVFTSGALSGCTMIYAIKDGYFYAFHAGQKPGNKDWKTGRDGVSSLASLVSLITGKQIASCQKNEDLAHIFSEFDNVVVTYMGKDGNILSSSHNIVSFNYNERERSGFEIRAAYSYALIYSDGDRKGIKVISEDVVVGLDGNISVNNTLKMRLY